MRRDRTVAVWAGRVGRTGRVSCRARPAEIARPRSVAELREVVLRAGCGGAAASGSRGRGHSFTPVVPDRRHAAAPRRAGPGARRRPRRRHRDRRGRDHPARAQPGARTRGARAGEPGRHRRPVGRRSAGHRHARHGPDQAVAERAGRRDRGRSTRPGACTARPPTTIRRCGARRGSRSARLGVTTAVTMRVVPAFTLRGSTHRSRWRRSLDALDERATDRRPLRALLLSRTPTGP